MRFYFYFEPCPKHGTQLREVHATCDATRPLTAVTSMSNPKAIEELEIVGFDMLSDVQGINLKVDWVNI